MGYWVGNFIVLLATFVVFRVVVRRDYLHRRSISCFAICLEIVI